MIKKKVVLLDLDNTLYEYEPIHQKSLNKVYKILKKEKKISQEEFLELYKISKKEIHRELAQTASSHNRVLYFQRLVEKLYDTVDSDIVLKLYNTYWDDFLENIKLWKWVIQTLKKLKELWIKTAIISDLTTNIQLRKMSKLGLSPFIDVLVTSEETGKEKPNPIMFLLALNKLNASPSEALMVGDNIEKDIIGWNYTWIVTVLITNKNSTQFSFSQDCEKPNYFINEISEIVKLL